MDVTRSEEQQELASIVASLLTRQADSGAVRAAMTSATGYDEQLWRTLVEQIGAAALNVPEEHDGAGYGLVESLVVLEELGRSLAPSPLLSSIVVTEALLAATGAAAEDARARLLPRIAAGEIAALVLDPEAVLDGVEATVLLAVVDDALVEVDPTSVRRTWAPSMDQTLRFARVDLADAVTTPIGQDAGPALARARQVGAVAVTALQVGLGARALDMTVFYTRDRVQFGRPIGSFQALKHRMAEMLVLLEMSRSASWTAAYAVATRTPDAERLTHVAKSYCSEALARIAAETVQLHGGIAITWEHDAHLVFKRSHALGQLFGSAVEHRRLVEL
ncbi:acyl-CoA dehydrogenase family protein [Nocardioides nanhaiensis]|uniref:Acyl-CoA dehydrogenase family protein n=1 Tax=Nocardioides nanhaiensis TaxID=1476871 RepID=A0ABP8WIF7_9ACTN